MDFINCLEGESPVWRRLVGVMAALAVLVVVAACGSGQANSNRGQSKSGGGVASISVAAPSGTLQAVPLVFAQDKGIMAKHGVKLNFITITGASALATALVSGSANMAISAVSSIWPLAKQGVQVEALVPTLVSYFNVIGQPNLPLNPQASTKSNVIANVRLLKGKTIGVAALGLSAPNVLMDYLLQQAGMSDRDVSIVATGNLATSVAAFKQKKIDALVTTPPDEEYLGKGAFKYVAHLADVSPYNTTLSGEVTTTSKYLDSNKDAVSRFCSAARDAYSYVLNPANTSEVVTFLQSNLDLPSKAIAQEVWTDWKASLIGNKPLSESLWQSAEFWENGTDTQGYVPSYGSHVDQKCT